MATLNVTPDFNATATQSGVKFDRTQPFTFGRMHTVIQSVNASPCLRSILNESGEVKPTAASHCRNVPAATWQEPDNLFADVLLAKRLLSRNSAAAIMRRNVCTLKGAAGPPRHA